MYIYIKGYLHCRSTFDVMAIYVERIILKIECDRYSTFRDRFVLFLYIYDSKTFHFNNWHLKKKNVTMRLAQLSPVPSTLNLITLPQVRCGENVIISMGKKGF